MRIVLITLLFVVTTLADVSHLKSQEVPILRQELAVQEDGSYNFGYETGNGINAQETGIGGQIAQGYYTYVAPDGTPIQVTYVADVNGFQPKGAHLPVPPPIPEEIQRALDYIAAHPPAQE